ncbi:MAG TPA: glycosyl hydrolase family 18 protein [Gaiellaceae bacterium]|nr:glycosyl hydrolase family 18 protein [Gaiellaceae bacterium]
MSPRVRFALPALLVVLVVLAGLILTGGLGAPTPSDAARDSLAPSGAIGPAPTPTPRPELGGTELYGYLPYWRMTDSTADYLRDVPLQTIALFSVGARRDGSINTDANGYERIAGPVGRSIIADAHARDQRVELVFTSFGERRNERFFATSDVNGASQSPSGAPAEASPAPAQVLPALSGGDLSPAPGAGDPAPSWLLTIPALVDLAVDLDVDGINVDVERLPETSRAGYGAFLEQLREALRREKPHARVSVASEAGERGVGNAAVAAAAGVDRIFLMGYDYHWSGSQPGASSPVDRIDGIYDLRWSIDAYVEAGVPRDRILLGLPLYGMQWRSTGADRFAEVIGSGQAWILDEHRAELQEDAFTPQRDPIEIAEFTVEQDGDTWLHTYFDSPATLRLKLALARDEGLAGGGFWAISYERGVPGYVGLMTDFRDGKVERSEAPPRR